MTQILKISNRDFKITMINLFKKIRGKVEK